MGLRRYADRLRECPSEGCGGDLVAIDRGIESGVVVRHYECGTCKAVWRSEQAVAEERLTGLAAKKYVRQNSANR